jgi:hypothetical protein
LQRKSGLIGRGCAASEREKHYTQISPFMLFS